MHLLVFSIGVPFSRARECDLYTAIRSSEVSPGDAVRAHLTGAAESRLRYVLPANARFAEGTVVSTGGDGLSLAVPVTSGYDDSGRLEQRINIGRNDITALELRTFDRVRSAILFVGGGAGVVAVLVRTFGGERGGTITRPGGDPMDAVIFNLIPVWRAVRSRWQSSLCHHLSRPLEVAAPCRTARR